MPLLVLLLLPIGAISAVLFTDTGIDPALLTATIKTFAILFVVGGALSFAASRLAARSN
ncbi:hypothetical protein [Methylobacterium organophilum]|uniref:hypothetical protein n=1 Tax=Methylobacterium organophilum TaxID=410 RepID=UPI003B84682F